MYQSNANEAITSDTGAVRMFRHPWECASIVARIDVQRFWARTHQITGQKTVQQLRQVSQNNKERIMKYIFRANKGYSVSVSLLNRLLEGT